MARIFLAFILLLLAALGAVPGPAPASAEPVAIRHALGTVELPRQAERVVSLEYTYTEDLVALGLTPLGVADGRGYRAWVGHGAELLAEAADVGTRQEPNLETIASLSPDLIIGPAFRHAPIHSELSSLAPTLLFDILPEAGMSQIDLTMSQFAAIGEAVGRGGRAREVAAGTAASIERARTALAEAGLTGARVLLVQFLPGTPHVRVFAPGSLAGDVMDRLGLRNAWDSEADRFGFGTVGIEALARFKGIHLLHVAQPDDEGFERLKRNPLWSRLDFVASGRVHPLPPDTWFFGGPLSIQALAERIASAMAG